ncbi:MAG: hypothetical protein R3E82_09695 [Pseudomonadales bacterium]
MNSANIVRVRVAAAHDGSAELQVTLLYPNGGRTEVTLDEPAGRALMTACEAREVDDLIGQNWEKVKDALTASFNRFQTAPGPTDPS